MHHIMLCASFTLVFFFFYVQANLLVIAVVLTLLSISVRGILPLYLTSNPPTACLFPLCNPKLTPFGCTLTIARSTTSICSVMAMRDYLLQCKSAATGPLFTFTTGKWLSRASLAKELRSALQRCGLPADHYFTHSFRVGAATTAAAAGVPSWLIKVLGRWSSDCYEHYIRTPQETLLAMPRKLVMHNSNVVI